MKPIKFEEANVVFGAEQDEYNNLPAHRTSDNVVAVTSCWQLTDEELAVINETKCIWNSQWTFGNPYSPTLLTVNKEEVIEEVNNEE